MTYQPPPGVWKSSPARQLLWATEQVLHRITKELPEQDEIDAEAKTIGKLLTVPVEGYNWARIYVAKYTKSVYSITNADDDPEVPASIITAWEKIPDYVQGTLWNVAGEMRASLEGLPFNPKSLAEGLAHSFEMVKSIPETSHSALRNLMKLSMSEQEGQFAFARRIKREWSTMSTAKSKQIAVTEWNRAASYATLDGYREQGVKLKRWFTVSDARVCEFCEMNAGEGDIPIDDGFATGADHPPEHPLCRCSVSSA